MSLVVKLSVKCKTNFQVDLFNLTERFHCAKLFIKQFYYISMYLSISKIKFIHVVCQMITPLYTFGRES